MFVLNLKEFFSDNFSLFLKGEGSSAFLIGAYRKEEDARKCIELIQDGKEQPAPLVGGRGWHILLWKKETDDLYTMALEEYYVGFTTLFKAGSTWEITPLELFTAKEAAEDMIEYIRLYIKDENGNIIR